MVLKLRFCALLWLAFSASACTQFAYQAKLVPEPTLEGMTISASSGPVIVAADPYHQTARQLDVFQADFHSAGIVPIQVLVKNGQSEQLRVRPFDVRLRLLDGKELSPAKKTLVADLTTPKAKVEVPRAPPHAPEVMMPSIMVGLAEAGPYEASRTDRLEDYRSKELKDTNIARGESVHGFLYFYVGADIEIADEATLVIPIIDTRNHTTYIVELRILIE